MKERSQMCVRSILILLGFFLVGAIGGCGEETNTTQVTPPAASSNVFFDKTATLQGAILDATTGARIGGTDLKMVLIQGVSHRAPAAIITDTTDPSLVGEYVFTDIPVSLNAGNNTFKIVVTKTGYQRFEGLVTLAVSGVVAASSTILVDAKFNFMGNIYLFREGQSPLDITVAVEYGKEPVVGATVLLQQNAHVNVPTTGAAVATTLVAAPGMLGSLSGTTTAEGKVTFSGSNLVLGGAYTPVVLPIVHDKTPSQTGGTRLQTKVGTQIIVGMGGLAHTQLISMGDLEPGNHADGLHVVFASNRDDGDVTGLTGLNSLGRLTLVFNRPIDGPPLTSTSTPFTAVLVKDVGGQATLNNPGGLGSVGTPSLSADGFTLTLNPVFATSTSTTTPVLIPIATDKNVKITYSGGGIRVQGDEAAAVIPLESLSYLDGTPIRREVTVLGP